MELTTVTGQGTTPTSEALDDRARFVAAFETHSRAILAYAVRRVAEPEDAADIAAETFLVAWRRMADLPLGPEERLWLFGVARLVLANYRRGRMRRAGLADRLRGELRALDLEQLTNQSEAAAAVRAAMARLNEQDRELLRLTSWEQLSPAEIATVLAIPAGTVRTRLHRARNRLREALRAIGWQEARTLEPKRTYGAERHLPFEGCEEDA